MCTANYARVSTLDQEPENQLAEIRSYIAARGWAAEEYVDRGVSGAKDRRPALDRLLVDARRRRVDVVVVWRLDRLGRNLRHLILLLEELQALGIAFVSLNEGIDATTRAGKLQLHMLGAIAEFERARIAERVKAGLQRARAQGKRLGRPRKVPRDDHHSLWLGARIGARLGRLEINGRPLDRRWSEAERRRPGACINHHACRSPSIRPAAYNGARRFP